MKTFWNRVLVRLPRKLGYLRVRCQSLLFPLSRGVFPPLWLSVHSAFPPEWKTDDRPHGLLAVGGSLNEGALLSAYSKGIHPLCDRHPVRWVVFNPRMVLFPGHTKLRRRLRTLIRSGSYRVTFDTAFEEVINRCSDRKYTWLVPERIDAAIALNEKGQAHSVEVWNRDGQLVGGLVGVDMGRVFIAESAFSAEPNTMKISIVYLACHLQHWGYELLDGQAHSDHLELLGFEEIPRRQYVDMLRKLAGRNIRYGKWSVDGELDVGAWKPSIAGGQTPQIATGA